MRSYEGVFFPFHPTEIVREAELGSPRLSALLRCPAHMLFAAYLQRALLAAAKGGHLASAEKLVSKGAKGFNEGMEIAMKESHHAVSAFLLLVQAVVRNDAKLVNKLLGPLVKRSPLKEYSAEQFRQLQRAWAEGQVSTAVAIQLASHLGHTAICEQLLARTGVKVEAGAVDWQGLRLVSLTTPYLMKVAWVKTLLLARSEITHVQSEVGLYLKKVRAMGMYVSCACG